MQKDKKGLKSKEIVMPRNVEGQIIGDDLCKFAELLVYHGICGDVGQIDNAGRKCKSNATETAWSYNGSLNFNLDNFGKSHPHDHKNLTLQFIIDIKANKIVSTQFCDPLESLFFDIVISGKSAEKEDVICCWHLDKHDKNPGIDDHYSHPKYHLTFGGDYLPQNGDYGSALILNTPRIAYPPMDAVLGIDFIIQNYIDIKKTKKLLNDTEYRLIVDKSQKRLWKPYFQSICSKWDYESVTFDTNYNHNKLFPFLV